MMTLGVPPPSTGITGIRPLLPMAELATAVDGGQVSLCIDSMPSQGLHIIPPNKHYHLNIWPRMLS